MEKLYEKNLSDILTSLKYRDHNTKESYCGSYSIFDFQIWNTDEVAKFLKVSRGHVYNLVLRREIPFKKKKKGGKLYFIPQEILEWISEEYDE